MHVDNVVSVIAIVKYLKTSSEVDNAGTCQRYILSNMILCERKWNMEISFKTLI